MYRFKSLTETLDVRGNPILHGATYTQLGDTIGDVDSFGFVPLFEDTLSFNPAMSQTPQLADDYPNDITTTGVIVVDGASVSGQIETAFDKDWFRIRVDEDGDIIALNLLSLTNDLIALELAFVRGNGRVFEQDFYVEVGETLFHQFETSGVYYVSVASYRPSSGPTPDTGDYTLSAVEIIDDYADDATTTGRITIDNTPIVGNIDFFEDRDWFRIFIPEDDFALGLFTNTTVPDGVYVDLYSAAGVFITRYFQGFIRDTIEFAGNYFISVEPVRDFQLGTYDITTRELIDDYSADVSTTGLVTLDGASVSGELELREDEDWFRFELASPEFVEFILVGGYGILSLYDDTGALLATREVEGDVRFGPLFYDFQMAGTYFIGFENTTDTRHSATVFYDLEANTVVDLAADASTTGVMSVGGPAFGSALETPDDVDWIRFTIDDAGDIVEFRFNWIDRTLSYSNFIVYDDLGGHVFGDSGGAQSTFFVNFSEAGTYYAELSNAHGNVGTYGLSAKVAEDDHRGDTSTTSTMPTDGTLVSGRIDHSFDEDWFEITITEDNLILGVDATDRIGIKIYDDTGTLISLKNLTQLDLAGTYYVAATYQNVIQNYSIAAVTYAPDTIADDISTTTRLNIGSVVSESLFTTADSDWFIVNIPEDNYTIAFGVDVTSIGDDIDNFLVTLYDENGTRLERIENYVFRNNREPLNDAGSDSSPLFSIAHTMVQTAGTYFISVEALGNFNDPLNIDGDYTISLEQSQVADDHVGNRSTTSEIALDGTTVNGRHDYNEDEDWFRFEINSPGETVTIFIDFAEDILIDIRGPQNSDANFLNSGDTVEVTFDSTGVYWLGVSNTFRSSDTYSVSMQIGSFNILSGTFRKDTLTGTTDQDYITGQSGDDILQGLAGDDRLLGGDGNDVLIGGAGADVLNGGDGIDAADYGAADARVVVNLRYNRGFNSDAEGDTFDSIENLSGSAFNDTLIGDFGANRLVGRDGNDLLRGLNDNDVLIGGNGDDRLEGGAENDLLLGGAGADVLIGGEDIDTVNYFDATGGVVVNLRFGFGKRFEAEGDTLSEIENIIGSSFNDILIGGFGENRITGRDGNDLIRGLNGDDVLLGNAGNDTIEGGAENDLIYGGLGDDILTGGEDSDTFIFEDMPGHDTITDFSVADDTLDFSALTIFASRTDVETAASISGSDILITIDGSNSILIQNFTMADLMNADMVF